MPENDEGQIVNAVDRLKIVLEAAGCSLSDIVELVSYHVGLQKHLARFVEIKSRYISAPFPTWTILEIAGLARPGLVIEIKSHMAPSGWGYYLATACGIGQDSHFARSAQRSSLSRVAAARAGAEVRADGF